MDIDLDLTGKLPISDAELMRRLRACEALGFMDLAGLLGNDARALKALREEAKFVLDHPEMMRGAAFAAAIRGYLVENKLEWSQENLQKAVSAHSPAAAEGAD